LGIWGASCSLVDFQYLFVVLPFSVEGFLSRVTLF
jgi:hypothetical protein